MGAGKGEAYEEESTKRDHGQGGCPDGPHSRQPDRLNSGVCRRCGRQWDLWFLICNRLKRGLLRAVLDVLGRIHPARQFTGVREDSAASTAWNSMDGEKSLLLPSFYSALIASKKCSNFFPGIEAPILGRIVTGPRHPFTPVLARGESRSKSWAYDADGGERVALFHKRVAAYRFLRYSRPSDLRQIMAGSGFTKHLNLI